MKNKHLSILFQVSLIILFSLIMWRITQNFGYAINMSHSLPNKLFFIHLKKTPHVGDYVLFKAPPYAKLPSDTYLIKEIFAKEGDEITLSGQNFYINGQWVAKAKTHSLKGEQLIQGPIGILKEGQYYVGTKHQDSFDSRYQRMGWIAQDLILGVAYPLW